MKLSYFFFFPQSGLIRTDNGEFFIEPLEKGQQDVEVKGRVHVVYRRLAIKKEAGQERQDLHNEGGSETLMVSVETSDVVYGDVCMFWLCVHTWLSILNGRATTSTYWARGGPITARTHTHNSHEFNVSKNLLQV